MKKYFSWVICAVLVVVSLLVMPMQNASLAGAGNKRAEKVESVEELGDVLAWLTGGDSSEIEPTAYDYNTPLSTGESEKYESATLYFVTDVGFEMRVDNQTAKTTMKREMTCYVTEDAWYYDIEAYIQTKQTSGGAVSNTAIKMSMDLYVSENTCLVYFDELSIFTRRVVREQGEEIDKTNEVENPNYEPMLRKWIDLSENGEELQDVTVMNEEILSTLGGYISRHEDDNLFAQSADTYTLRNQFRMEFVAALLGIEGGVSDIPEGASFDSEFEVDLSTPKCPKMNVYYNVSGTNQIDMPYFEDGEILYSKYSQNITAVERMGCEISEINNTVVKEPNGEIYSLKDFEDLM